MQIVTKATNFEVTEALKDYVEKRMAHVKKLVTEHQDEVALIDVELSKSKHHKHGDIFRAEVNFCIGGKCYRAVSEKDNIYAAIDEIKDELGSGFSSYKKKHLRILRRGGAKVKRIIKGLFQSS